MMRYRNRVLGMLSLLSVITYLDRVCISVAGPRMQESLHLGPAQWGWVTGIFTLAYSIFEIPTGTLGDRIGPRRVLTRVVLWWSAFTSLTGAALGYRSLLAARFLFGAGEAGAYPNISIVIARWFPLRERGRAFGIILMAARRRRASTGPKSVGVLKSGLRGCSMFLNLCSRGLSRQTAIDSAQEAYTDVLCDDLIRRMHISKSGFEPGCAS